MQNFLHNGKFGLQLWSVKEEMEQAPQRTLEQVAAFGYHQIETFEGAQGRCWSMVPRDFKAFVHGLGMEIVAAHCDVFNDFEQKVETAVETGMRFLVCPWLGANDNLDFYRQAAARFNYCGELCRQAGIGFAYHNHDYSFLPVEGISPIELFLQETDPALVSFEMDIFWVVAAGHDPGAWLRANPERWPLVHLKDKVLTANNSPHESTRLGQGTIDFSALLAGQYPGIEWWIAEQEQFAGDSPMEAARANAAYMRSLLSRHSSER